MSFGQFILGIYGSITYNVVIMYSFYFMFASFTSVLPWTGCNNGWNTELCADRVKDCLKDSGIIALNNSCVLLRNLNSDELSFYNITYDGYGINDTGLTDGYNVTHYVDPYSQDRVTSSEEYWR